MWLCSAFIPSGWQFWWKRRRRFRRDSFLLSVSCWVGCWEKNHKKRTVEQFCSRGKQWHLKCVTRHPLEGSSYILSRFSFFLFGFSPKLSKKLPLGQDLNHTALNKQHWLKLKLAWYTKRVPLLGLQWWSYWNIFAILGGYILHRLNMSLIFIVFNNFYAPKMQSHSSNSLIYLFTKTNQKTSLELIKRKV